LWCPQRVSGAALNHFNVRHSFIRVGRGEKF